MLCLTSALHFLAKDSDHQGEGVRINFVGLRLLLSKGMLEGPILSQQTVWGILFSLPLGNTNTF